jgi:hypothetical protein
VTVSTEEFIKAWQTSATTAEVCKKTGQTNSAASSRARLLRKIGIPLKKMRMGRTAKMDLEAMKKLAADCLKNGVPE